MDKRLKDRIIKENYTMLFDEKSLTFSQINEKAKNKDAFMKKYLMQFVEKIAPDEKAKMPKKYAVKVLEHNFNMEDEYSLEASCAILSNDSNKMSNATFRKTLNIIKQI